MKGKHLINAPPPGAEGRGKIYRVANTTGSTEITGTLLITDEADAPFENMTLDKIGHTTGWSYGQVFNTCANIRGASGVVFLCQGRVTASADVGDSGAPVFLWNGDTVTMYGILRGGSASDFSFSPMGGIWADLGYMPSYSY